MAPAAPAAAAQGDAALEVAPETAAKLLRQIEYYFSDMSFPFDSCLPGPPESTEARKYWDDRDSLTYHLNPNTVAC